MNFAKKTKYYILLKMTKKNIEKFKQENLFSLEIDLAALRNFVVVVTKHDDQYDESEDDHEEEGDNNSNHSVTGFFGIRFVALKITLGKA